MWWLQFSQDLVGLNTETAFGTTQLVETSHFFKKKKAGRQQQKHSLGNTMMFRRSNCFKFSEGFSHVYLASFFCSKNTFLINDCTILRKPTPHPSAVHIVCTWNKCTSALILWLTRLCSTYDKVGVTSNSLKSSTHTSHWPAFTLHQDWGSL